MMGDQELVRAVEANFVGTWSLLAEAAGGEVHEEPEARWIAAGDHPFFNAVIETRSDPLPDPAAIEQIATRIVERAGSCLWWVLPSAAPTRLAEHLGKVGFTPWGSAWPGMGVELNVLRSAPAVPGLELVRVDGDEALDEYFAAFDATLSPGPGFTAAFRRAATAIGFGMDAPMAHFIVRENERPVACASLIEAGGAAGLYNVGTVEGARGRGVGAWVSSMALLDGRRRGHSLGVLQSSTMGYRVYERLGFREVCRLARHIRPAPPAES